MVIIEQQKTIEYPIVDNSRYKIQNSKIAVVLSNGCTVALS